MPTSSLIILPYRGQRNSLRVIHVLYAPIPMPRGGPKDAIWMARALWWARAAASSGVSGRDICWETVSRRFWMNSVSLVGV